MRPVIYFVATTLDGFIAREDGSFADFPWDEAYGAELFETFPETVPVHIRGAGHDRSDNRWFDAVLMGRETYEVGAREGVMSPYPTLDQYVFSRTMRESPHADVTLVREDASGCVAALKRESGKAIWLCGGAGLASSLLSAGLIDQLVVKLNPVVFGRGIPLLREATAALRLDLMDSKTFPSGHARLHYAVRPR